jgi:hypothetical protein
MSMLAFFPWLDLDEELRLPEFSLVQFQRGRLPGGEIQTALDAVMEIYVVGDNRPVSKGTMVQLPGHTLTDDLTDDERSELFVLAELTALAGLAKREYFAPFHYANRALVGGGAPSPRGVRLSAPHQTSSCQARLLCRIAEGPDRHRRVR